MPNAGMKLTDMKRKMNVLAAITCVPKMLITHIVNSDHASTSATICTPDGIPTRSSVKNIAARGFQSRMLYNLRTTGRLTKKIRQHISTNTPIFCPHADPATPSWGKPRWPKINAQAASTLADMPIAVAINTELGRSTARRNCEQAVPISLIADPPRTLIRR